MNFWRLIREAENKKSSIGFALKLFAQASPKNSFAIQIEFSLLLFPLATMEGGSLMMEKYFQESISLSSQWSASLRSAMASM
jgi:hypothetical protein